MGKLTNNQKGFGAVEGLLILIIVGMLAFTGWYVVHNKNTAAPTQTTTPTSTPILPEETPKPTETNTIKYVTIKEWGIKIPEKYLPKGFSYEVPSSSNSSRDSMVFNSDELKAAGCTIKGYGLIVVRGTASDKYITHAGDSVSLKDTYDGYAQSSQFHMKYGQYYYFDDSGRVCGGGEKEAAAQNKIGSALKHMEDI